MKIALLVFFTSSCAFSIENSDDFINEINSKQNFWKAGRNFHKNTPNSRLHHLFGMKEMPEQAMEKVPVMIHEITDEIPESFDARIRWPECRSIKVVPDQSSCNSGWAVSVATAISDRICIHSGGKLQPDISVRNLMSCEENSDGCFGGIPYYAWEYWKNNGTVTGGSYGSKIGCQPYPFAPCEHHIDGPIPQCSYTLNDTPACNKACDNSTINYETDLIYGASAYKLPKNEQQIQAEILKNGPVAGGFDEYADFLHYKSGVYVPTSDVPRGRHAIKIIGWGIENATKYWLVMNSWNEDWGDKGLFKIRRGVNECEIESFITAGLPK